MIDLPDLNVWLAMANENHRHHKTARNYWENQSTDTLNFCRITMLGFLRLLTHAKVMGDRPFSPPEAWQAYLNFLALPEVEFLNEPASLEKRLMSFSGKPDFPQSLWTDAYLAALAVESSRRIVSFDSDFTRFKGLDFLHLQAPSD